jgi:hypothetical protein
MLRTSNTLLRSAGHHVSRRRHRFVPLVGGSASGLEGRALLSSLVGGALPGASHPFIGQSPRPNGSVPPIIADASVSGADVAFPSKPHAHVGTLPGKGPAPRGRLSLPEAAPQVRVLALNHASGHGITPNGLSSSPPPNGSVPPIIA